MDRRLDAQTTMGTGEPRAQNGSHDPRSLGSLFVELTKETSALLRAEVELAKSEIEEKVEDAQRGVISMASGGAVLFVGVLTLVACLVLALSEVWPPWAAALVVGLVVSGVGAFLLMRGRVAFKASHLKPTRTIASIQSTTAMAKEQMS
jgi:hypothetical protein